MAQDRFCFSVDVSPQNIILRLRRVIFLLDVISLISSYGVSVILRRVRDAQFTIAAITAKKANLLLGRQAQEQGCLQFLLSLLDVHIDLGLVHQGDLDHDGPEVRSLDELEARRAFELAVEPAHGHAALAALGRAGGVDVLDEQAFELAAHLAEHVSVDVHLQGMTAVRQLFRHTSTWSF